jgi:GT2 family glycosyltransferase
LIVKPAVDLDELAIDQLLTLADRFPQAGLYGGCGVDETGGPTQTTCLVRRRRDDVRVVPVLTATFLLVDMQLWSRLGGFNERVKPYGQDVDLCVWAIGLGATPMLTPSASHRSGAGSSSFQENDGVDSDRPASTYGRFSPGSGRLQRGKKTVLTPGVVVAVDGPHR